MEEPIPSRYAFMMLLAISDPTGHVIGTDVAIARRINMPPEDFHTAIEILKQPDPDSNSKEEEGRRIVMGDGERGYRIVNYVTYRELKDEVHRREYMREYMRGYRGGKHDVNSGKLLLTQLEGEVQESKRKEEEAPPKKEPTISAGKPPRVLKAKKESVAHPDFKAVVEWWSASFQTRFGAPYAFQGGQDGKAVNLLLSHFKTGVAVIEFAVRVASHRGFWCDKATTLAILAAKISVLQAEMVTPTGKSRQTESQRDSERTGLPAWNRPLPIAKP